MAEQKIRFEDLVDAQSMQAGFEKLADNLENQLVGAMSKVKTALKSELGAVQGASPSTPKGQAEMKRAAQAVRELTKEQKALLESQTRLNTLRATYRKELKDTIALEKAEKGSVVALRIQLKKLTEQYNRAGATQRKSLQPQIKKTSDELKKLERAVGNNTRNVGNYKGALKSLGKQLLLATGLAGGMTMALRGAFNVIKNGFKTTIDFEQSMSRVKSITGATGKEFDDLRASAIKLGGSTAFTASEVSALQKEYAKLGFTTEEILKVTKGTLDLAAATGEDLAESTAIAGATLRGFGLAATQMQRVVDVMAESFTSSALDLNKFKISMQNVGPVASAVGVSIEGATAKLGVLANAGLDASMSGTSLRNIFLELEKQGLSWDEAMTKINTSSNKASTSLDLFGKRGAVAGIILASNTESALEMEEAFNDAEGAASEMAAINLENVAGEITRLKSAWEGLILRTNESTGALQGFLAGLTDVISTINNDGIPVLDSFFKDTTSQIETLTDKMKFFADVTGKGFIASIAAASLTSRKKVQLMQDALVALNEEQKAIEAEALADQAALDAAEQVQNKANLDALNAANLAELEKREAAQEIIDDRIKAATTQREKDSLATRKDLLKQEEDAFKDVQIAKVKTATDAEGKITTVQSDRIDDLQEINSTELASVKQQNTDIEAEERAHAETLKQINKEIADDKRQKDLESLQKGLEIAQQAATAFINIVEAQKQRELSAAGDNAEARAEIEAKFRKKQQSAAIAQAIINGALAVTKTFADLGFIPGLPFAALQAAVTASQVALISSQKFAKGGFGVLGGNLHASGGTMIPGVGEAEKGEAVGIISRRATHRYGSDMLEGVFKSLENGTFTDVFGRANAHILNVNVPSDPYLRKLYEHTVRVPVYYVDTNGDTVEVMNGQKRVIRHG